MAHSFKSKATAWGCEHKIEALGVYTRLQQSKHADFKVCHSGLWIHPSHPLLAASPDAIAHCSCHGFRCVEIKCPFKFTTHDISDLAEFTTRDISDLAENDRLFCLSQGLSFEAKPLLLLSSTNAYAVYWV